MSQMPKDTTQGHVMFCIETLSCMCMLNHFTPVQLFGTLWTIARQAPLSMGFSRQEYWNGLPCPPPGDLLNPRIERVSLELSALAGMFFTSSVI